MPRKIIAASALLPLLLGQTINASSELPPDRPLNAWVDLSSEKAATSYVAKNRGFTFTDDGETRKLVLAEQRNFNPKYHSKKTIETYVTAIDLDPGKVDFDRIIVEKLTTYRNSKDGTLTTISLNPPPEEQWRGQYGLYQRDDYAAVDLFKGFDDIGKIIDEALDAGRVTLKRGGDSEALRRPSNQLKKLLVQRVGQVPAALYVADHVVTKYASAKTKSVQPSDYEPPLK